jgi:hypothetical protein
MPTSAMSWLEKGRSDMANGRAKRAGLNVQSPTFPRSDSFEPKLPRVEAATKLKTNEPVG